jgi:hypothetical protein
LVCAAPTAVEVVVVGAVVVVVVGAVVVVVVAGAVVVVVGCVGGGAQDPLATVMLTALFGATVVPPDGL